MDSRKARYSAASGGCAECCAVPRVDLRLKSIPSVEQRAVLRSEIPDDVLRASARTFVGIDHRYTGAISSFDQVMQTLGDAEAADLHSVVHRSLACIA